MGIKGTHTARLAVSAGLVAALMGSAALAPVVVFAEDAPVQLPADGGAAGQDTQPADTLGEEQKAASVLFKDGSTAEYSSLGDAAKDLQDGATLTLLQDFETSGFGIKITVPNVTIDLNGHSMTSTKETANQNYGYLLQCELKQSGSFTVKNSGAKQSVLSGRFFQIIADGPSKGFMDVSLEGDIAMKSTYGEAWQNGLLLKDTARIVDSDAARSAIRNGGFLVETSDGGSYVYGDSTHAFKDAKSGTTVYLIGDYVTNAAITSGTAGGTLDCGGHTITYTKNMQFVDVNHKGVSLVIKDATFVAQAEVLTKGGATILQNDASLVLDGVTMVVPGDTYGIVTNGTNTNINITMVNSSLVVEEGQGIYFPSSGSVKIDNSSIAAKHVGVQLCSGSLTVTGKDTKITATGDPIPKVENDGGIADGSAISIVNRSYPGDTPTAVIEAGTFTSASSSSAIKAYSFSNSDKTEGAWESAGDSVSISGGAFSSVPTYFENLLAEGHKSVIGQDGSVSVTVPAENGVAKVGETYFITLGDAFEAAEDGDEIDLIKEVDISDVAGTIEVEAGKTVTLDLNGQVLKAANNRKLSSYGTLKVKDSTDSNRNGTGAGKIVATKPYNSMKYGSGLIAACSGGSVVIESGLIDAATAFAGNNANEGQFGLAVDNSSGDATVVINGGKVIAGWYAVSGNGSNTAHQGTIVVNGGELVSTADYAIYSPQAGGVTITGGTVTGACGAVHIQRGALAVSGGSLASTGTGSTGQWGDGTSGSGNAVIDANGKYGSVKVSISGGAFASEGNSELIHKGDPKDGETIEVTITGGTYNKDPKDFIANGYVAEQSGGIWKVGEKVTPPTGGGTTTPSDKTEVEKNPDGSTTTTVTKPDGSQTVTTETATGTESVVKKDKDGSVTSTVITVSKEDAAAGKVGLPIDGVAPAADADKAPEVEIEVPSAVGAGKPVRVTVPVDVDGRDYGVVAFAVDGEGNETVLPKCTVDKDGNLVFEATGDVTIKVVDNAKDMPDVDGADWFAGDVVDFATARGIVEGSLLPGGAREFRGHEPTTRAQLAAMLHNLESSPLPDAGAALPDVSASDWFAEAALWANGAGIFEGYGQDGRFGGEDGLTRAQLAVALMRYAEHLGLDTSASAELGFPDAAGVPSWASRAMSWAVAEGLVSGYGDTGLLDPEGPAERAQVAAVLMRFINLMYA